MKFLGFEFLNFGQLRASGWRRCLSITCVCNTGSWRVPRPLFTPFSLFRDVSLLILYLIDPFLLVEEVACVFLGSSPESRDIVNTHGVVLWVADTLGG